MSEVTDLREHKRKTANVDDMLAPDGFLYGEQGLADRLIDDHGGDLIFNHTRSQWMRWVGPHFEVDDKRRAQRAIKHLAKRLFELSIDAPGEHRDRLQKLAKSALRDSTQKHVLSLASVHPDAAVVETELDHDIWSLPVRNGVVDLRTGELREASRSDRWSRCVSASFDPSAIAPTFERFLEEIFEGDVELITYVQRIAGYCLTGSVREQCLFIWHGSGANGKSVLLNALLRLLADFGQQAPMRAFLAKRNEDAAGDLARASTARLVAATESNRNRSLDEAMIKKITGGDPIPARFLYSNPFEYQPKFKIILCTNHLPKIGGTDHAIWRRMRRVPFNVVIPKERQDPDLLDKLVKEIDGVLAWAVMGAVDWYRRGKLDEPEIVVEATNEYRAQEDTLGQFIDDACFVNTSGPESDRPFESSATLIEAIKAYSGRKDVTHSTLRDDLGSRPEGFISGKRSVDGKRCRGWIGLEVKPEYRP